MVRNKKRKNTHRNRQTDRQTECLFFWLFYISYTLVVQLDLTFNKHCSTRFYVFLHAYIYTHEYIYSSIHLPILHLSIHSYINAYSVHFVSKETIKEKTWVEKKRTYRGFFFSRPINPSINCACLKLILPKLPTFSLR